MKADDLSTHGRELVRAVADGTEVTPAEIGQMFERGLIETESAKPKLTEMGRRLHKEIMASGDGPESLKELLQF